MINGDRSGVSGVCVAALAPIAAAAAAAFSFRFELNGGLSPATMLDEVAVIAFFFDIFVFVDAEVREQPWEQKRPDP
jgi:hypothetical protein